MVPKNTHIKKSHFKSDKTKSSLILMTKRFGSIHKNLSFMSFLIFKIFLQNKYDTKEHGIQQRT